MILCSFNLFCRNQQILWRARKTQVNELKLPQVGSILQSSFQCLCAVLLNLCLTVALPRLLLASWSTLFHTNRDVSLAKIFCRLVRCIVKGRLSSLQRALSKL